MIPAGFIAVLCGWFVTEMGRQPYVVYGLLKTADAHSPLSSTQVLLSLMIFFIVYTFVFCSGMYYLRKIIQKGPVPYVSGTPAEIYGTVQHSFEKTDKDTPHV